MLSPLAVDHVQNPRNFGKLSSANCTGTAGAPGDGPYCTIHLRLEDGRIREASYETYGCPTSIASASILVQLITGRPVDRVLLLEEADLMRVIGSVPLGKEECPGRALRALRTALDKRN